MDFFKMYEEVLDFMLNQGIKLDKGEPKSRERKPVIIDVEFK